jgi:hypothetical protein
VNGSYSQTQVLLLHPPLLVRRKMKISESSPGPVVMLGSKQVKRLELPELLPPNLVALLLPFLLLHRKIPGAISAPVLVLEKALLLLILGEILVLSLVAMMRGLNRLQKRQCHP